MGKTIFVLGAGASRSYGYPTGKELRKRICEDSVESFTHILRNIERWEQPHITQNVKPVNDFVNAFKRSSIFSIDYFLSQNSSYEDVGKRCIVQAILRAEQSSRFREDVKDFETEDWYSYLFAKMLGSSPKKESYVEFNKNDYSFVTFNYDRSLEHFLWESFRNSYMEIGEEQLKKQLRKTKIYHVYGKLDGLSWQDDGSHFFYKQENCNLVTLNSLIKNIRTIHSNERCNVSEMKEIQDLIVIADKIVFFGFGFSNENLNVLGIPELLKASPKIRYMYAATMGFTEKEKNELKKTFAGTCAHDNNIFWAPSDWNILRLFRERDF